MPPRRRRQSAAGKKTVQPSAKVQGAASPVETGGHQVDGSGGENKGSERRAADAGVVSECLSDLCVWAPVDEPVSGVRSSPQAQDDKLAGEAANEGSFLEIAELRAHGARVITSDSLEKTELHAPPRRVVFCVLDSFESDFLQAHDVRKGYQKLFELRALFVSVSVLRVALSTRTALPHYLFSFPARDELPAKSSPHAAIMAGVVIRSLALRTYVLCSSGYDRAQTTELQLLAASCGARFDCSFATSVTHLIAERAGSAKQRYASTHGIPVVTQDWLRECARERQALPTEQFALPPLASLGFAGYALSAAEELRMQHIIEMLGGVWMPSYADETVSHVVIGSRATIGGPASNAKRTNGGIFEVSPHWVELCKKRNALMDELAVATLPRDHVEQLDSVAEAQAAESKVLGLSAGTKVRDSPHGYSDLDDLVNEACAADAASLEAGRCDMYLDPVVYCVVTGSNLADDAVRRDLLENFKASVRRAGGTELPCLDYEMLTHAIVMQTAHGTSDVSGLDTAQLRQLALAAVRGVYITSVPWLAQCVLQRELVPWSSHAIDVTYLLGQREELEASRVPDASLSAGLLAGQGSHLGRNVSLSRSNAAETNTANAVFRGLRFNVGPLAMHDSRSSAALSLDISSAGGKILHHDFRGRVYSGVPTHVLCPSVIRVSENEVEELAASDKSLSVTAAWIEASLRQQKLLAPSECILYQPVRTLEVPRDGVLFARCSICLSGFMNKKASMNYRRDVLIQLIQMLGAHYSEELARRSTTHLVVDKAAVAAEARSDAPRSKKIARAKQWHINIVDLSWLLHSARRGEPLAADTYLVQDDVVFGSPTKALTQEQAETAGTDAQNPDMLQAQRRSSDVQGAEANAERESLDRKHNAHAQHEAPPPKEADEAAAETKPPRISRLRLAASSGTSKPPAFSVSSLDEMEKGSDGATQSTVREAGEGFAAHAAAHSHHSELLRVATAHAENSRVHTVHAEHANDSRARAGSSEMQDDTHHANRKRGAASVPEHDRAVDALEPSPLRHTSAILAVEQALAASRNSAKKPRRSKGR